MTFFFLTAAGVLGIDRLLKTLLEGLEGPLIPGILRLTTVHNTGTAMGLIRDLPAVALVLPGAVLLGVLFAARKLASAPLSRAALGAIFGGALGNLADRLLYGYVIDLFDFEFMRFYVFNFADAAIVVGGVLCALTLFFAEDRCWKGKTIGEEHHRDR